MKKIMTIMLMTLMILVFVTSCMPGDGSYTDGHMANFISGIWHGWIAPISLIRSLFNSNIRIYEVNNTGWWYDLGFYMAIISGFGGISLSRKRKKDRD